MHVCMYIVTACNFAFKIMQLAGTHIHELAICIQLRIAKYVRILIATQSYEWFV